MKNAMPDVLMIHCIKCNKTEEEVPLVVLRFQGLPRYICPQCFPLLIHKPEALADKFPGLEHIPPSIHD